MLKNKKLFKPLWGFVIYIVFTLLVSIYGPIQYVDYNYVSVVLYVSAFLLLFSFSYWVGIKKRINFQFYSCSGSHYKIIINLVKFTLAVTTVYYIALLWIFFKEGGSLDISQAGQAYVDLYSDYQRGSGNYSLKFLSSIVIHPFYMIALILGAYYFTQLSNRYRFMLATIILIELLVNAVGYGKMKYVGDIVIFISVIVFIKIYTSKSQTKLLKYVFILGVFGILALVYLLQLRYAAIGIDFDTIHEKSHHLMVFDSNGLLSELTYGFSIAALSQYLTQGWYGLSLALQLPFEWTYGFGNSYSMMIVYDRFLFGESLLNISYPYRVGSIFYWGENQEKWYSWFTWFASDVSFFGVLLLALPMGYLYAMSWRESILFSNPISIFIFSLQTLGLIFLPANNQLLHTLGGVIVFSIAIVLWLSIRKYFNFMPIK